MADAKGLLDTSVVLDHDLLDPALLPDEAAISAVTLAELAAGPHAPTIRTNGHGGRIGCSGPRRRGTPCRSTPSPGCGEHAG